MRLFAHCAQGGSRWSRRSPDSGRARCRRAAACPCSGCRERASQPRAGTGSSRMRKNALPAATARHCPAPRSRVPGSRQSGHRHAPADRVPRPSAGCAAATANARHHRTKRTRPNPCRRITIHFLRDRRAPRRQTPSPASRYRSRPKFCRSHACATHANGNRPGDDCRSPHRPSPAWLRRHRSSLLSPRPERSSA